MSQSPLLIAARIRSSEKDEANVPQVSDLVDSQNDCSRKVLLRIMPLCMLLYIVQYLERTNVSLAALQMNRDIGLTDSHFGTGYSLLYLGYIVFALPSAWLYNRFNVKWIAAMMLFSGLCACCMSLVWNYQGFYLVRFCIGVAEAGFLPSMLIYLAGWFPERRLSAVYSVFSSSVPICSILSGPLASAFLSISGGSLHGWQILYIAEGAPGILMSILVLFLLPADPNNVSWLSEEEKAWVFAHRKEQDVTVHREAFNFRRVLHLCRQVGPFWGYIAGFTMVSMGFFTWGAFFPTMLSNETGWASWIVALCMTFPALGDMAGRAIFGYLTTRLQEYFWHTLASMCLACVFTISVYLFSLSDSYVAIVAMYSCTTMMGGGVFPTFMAYLARTLPPDALSLGMTIFNTFASGGAMLGPLIAGQLKGGTFMQRSMYTVACWLTFVVIALVTRFASQLSCARRKSSMTTSYDSLPLSSVKAS